MKKIGFIGVGIMGKSMVRNLLKAGFEVGIYTRTREKAEDIIGEGAVWYPDPASCAKDKDCVITIVGYPEDVEEIYFGEKGILKGAAPGTCLIDMPTTSPKLAKRIYEEAGKKGCKALDAPVTGGDTGAREGTLTILAGGDQEDFERCLPVFEAMGKAIRYTGGPGNGQHTKMCNQIAIAGSIAGVCEAITYARANGLDERNMVESIATGAAGSAQLNAQAPKILSGDFEPGFFIKHFVKDMKIAEEEAQRAGISLGVLTFIRSMYENMEENGHGDEGTQALIKYYQW